MRKLNLPGTYWRGLAAQCAQKKPCYVKPKLIIFYNIIQIAIFFEFVFSNQSTFHSWLRVFFQRLQERYSSARIHARLNTPGSTFETPETDPTGGASKEDYDPAQPTPDQTPGGTSTAATSSSGVDPTKPTESLDKFMAKHTSEDNESFSDLMDEEYKVWES